MDKQELRHRLRGVRHSIDADTREDHLRAIHAAASAAEPAGVLWEASAKKGVLWEARRKVVAGVGAAVLVGLPSVAAASQDALPGDALYGVKKATETIQSLFGDEDAAAENRVEELEALLSNETAQGAVSDALDRAEEALANLPESAQAPDLAERLAAVQAIVDANRNGETPGQGGRDNADDRAGDNGQDGRDNAGEKADPANRPSQEEDADDAGTQSEDAGTQSEDAGTQSDDAGTQSENADDAADRADEHKPADAGDPDKKPDVADDATDDGAGRRGQPTDLPGVNS